jgi:hypothetical protein
MNVDAYVSPKPIWLVTRDIAVIHGLMSSRGHATPRRTAASILASQVLGMPLPSPKKIMSNRPRSAIRAMSSNKPTSG